MPTDKRAALEAYRGRANTGLLIGLAVATLLLAALDLAYVRHPHFAIEERTGFYAFCGAGTALLCIVIARLLRSIAVRRGH